MNIQLSLLLSFLAGLGTLLGSLLIFIPKLNKRDYMPLFLSISATIMLAFSVLDLIPESIIYLRANINSYIAWIYILVPFFIGVLTVNLINKIYKEDNKLMKISIMSFISLTLHNFPEGIITFLTTMVNLKLGISLTIGIMLHNLPEGICLAMPLYQATKNKMKVILYSLIVSLTEPLGGLLAYLFLKNYINNLTISIMLLFVSGIMITLSINNIYKEVLDTKVLFLKGIVIGLIITVIALLI